MVTTRTAIPRGATTNGQEVAETSTPRSVEIASRGINNTHDFKNFFRALIPDIMTDQVSKGKANAVCNATGKMLKIIEMEMKYGKPDGDLGPKIIDLCDDAVQVAAKAPDPNQARILELKKELAELESASGKVVNEGKA